MAVKNNSKKASVKTIENTTTTTVEVKVVTNNLLENSMNDGIQSQRANSIFMELSNHPEIVAITGLSMWQQIFGQGEKATTDIVLGLRVVPSNDQEKTRIVQLRAFLKMDETLGKLVPKSLAYTEAAKICVATGAQIKEMGAIGTRPNLKDFKWVAIDENKIPVVVITPRESNGRCYPNRVTVYKPVEVKATAENGNFLEGI